MACSSGGPITPPPPPPPPPPVATTIEVAPGTATLESFGATRQLAAQIRDQHGQPVPGVTIAWTPLDPAVASVSASGLATAVSDGIARVVATHAELRDTAFITVAQRATSIAVTSSDTVLLGLTSTATATAIVRDARGNVMSAAPTWSTSLPGRASVAAGGTVTAHASGSVRLTATVGTLMGHLDLVVYGTTGIGEAPVDRVVARFMAKHGIPGAALSVTHQGRLVHARGYGLADTVTGRAVVPGDPFRLASLSKSITAVSLMQLVEAGTVGLDDPVFTTWLPDLLPPGGPSDPRQLDQTVRHLAQHASGWNHPPNDPMFSAGAIAAATGVPSPPGITDIIRYMGTQPMQFAPGASRFYSNVGYATLGRVIEAATGAPYIDHVRNTLLMPIGATSFARARTFADQQPDNEVSYYHGGNENVLVNSVFANRPGQVPIAYGGFHAEALEATGGWIASAPDMARFLLAVDGRPDHPDVISMASRDLLGTDPGLDGNLAGYGMGWFRIGSVMFGTGRLPGQASVVVIDDARELTWTLLLNWSLPTVEFSNEYANVLTQVITNHQNWPPIDLFDVY